MQRHRVPAISALAVRREAGAAFSQSGVESLRRLVKAFGTSGLSRLIDVDRAQVSRWNHGKDTMSFEMRRRVVDLAYVMDRALQVFASEVVGGWLLGSEPFLGGARPIDVLLLKGVGPVVRALDLIFAGALP